MTDTTASATAQREPISHPAHAQPGLNEVVAKTVHYGPMPMIFEKDVPVTVRDGTVLYANVFRPPKDGRFPVVISADIYGKDSIHMVQAATMPKPGPNTLGQFAASDFAAWEAPDPGFWVPNDYAVVKLALRGTSGSKGRIAPLSLMEAQDYYDAIEWAGGEPWSNGNVGTNGVSYLAMTQWRVGQLNPPHLKAMIPWEGVSDIYRDLAFHGGIRDTSFTPFLDVGARRRWPDSELDALAAAQQAHPLFDAYWQERTGNLADIRVPILVCASWSTQGMHNRGTIDAFRQSASAHKWIEIHGRKEWEVYYAREQLERQKRFFDYFLKGIENDWLETPRVRYEVRDRFYEGRTKFAQAWPLPETRYVPLYLDVASRALVDTPVGEEASVRYDSTAPNRGARPRRIHDPVRGRYGTDWSYEAQAVGFGRRRRRHGHLRRAQEIRSPRRRTAFPRPQSHRERRRRQGMAAGLPSRARRAALHAVPTQTEARARAQAHGRRDRARRDRNPAFKHAVSGAARASSSPCRAATSRSRRKARFPRCMAASTSATPTPATAALTSSTPAGDSIPTCWCR